MLYRIQQLHVDITNNFNIISSRPRRIVSVRVFNFRNTNNLSSSDHRKLFLVIGLTINMDSPEQIQQLKKIPVVYLLFRCGFVSLFALIFFLLAVFTVVILALFISNISISYPISVPCQCKIVSSSKFVVSFSTFAVFDC